MSPMISNYLDVEAETSATEADGAPGPAATGRGPIIWKLAAIGAVALVGYLSVTLLVSQGVSGLARAAPSRAGAPMSLQSGGLVGVGCKPGFEQLAWLAASSSAQCAAACQDKDGCTFALFTDLSKIPDSGPTTTGVQAPPPSSSPTPPSGVPPSTGGPASPATAAPTAQSTATPSPVSATTPSSTTAAAPAPGPPGAPLAQAGTTQQFGTLPGVTTPPIQYVTLAPDQYVTLTNQKQYVTLTNPKQYATLTNPEQYATLTNPEQYVTLTSPKQYATLTNPKQYVTLPGDSTSKQYVTLPGDTTSKQYVTLPGDTTSKQYVTLPTDTNTSPQFVTLPAGTTSEPPHHYVTVRGMVPENCVLGRGRCDQEPAPLSTLMYMGKAPNAGSPAPTDVKVTGVECGKGCSNWESIKLEIMAPVELVQCEQRCNALSRCAAYNFQFDDCEESAVGAGTCYIFGAGCQEEDNVCWTLFKKPL